MINRSIFSIFVILISAICSLGQQREVRVYVNDSAGASVAGANVALIERGNGAQCVYRDDAYHCFVPPANGFTIRVDAKGFKMSQVVVAKESAPVSEYVIVLQVSSIEETVVTIGRTESRVAETPESVSVVNRSQIETTAAPTLDDALRQVPGFSIFRRSSSRNANPTTQGVSLRGVGASGASRSVVMLDGVPLNDSFGGWVQWSRVSPIAIETVEVLRGGASSLYGGSGLGGAIDLVSRKANDDDFVISAEAFGGSQRTLSGSAFAGGEYKDWFGDVSGGHFQTQGFFPVDKNERGSVDSFAGVRSMNFSGRAKREFGDTASVFFRPSYFGESRANGTPAQINRTHSRQFVLGGALNVGPKSLIGINWRAYSGTQVYDQTFSAVTADRTTENLTRVQRSPSQNVGFSTQFSAYIRDHNIVSGIEGREVRGASDEIVLSNGRATSLVGTGGLERTIAGFAKDVWSIGKRVMLSGTLRYDGWKNLGGYSVTRSLSTSLTASTIFPDRKETALSPQASLLIQATDQIAIHASMSKSFRAPTLNELYRSFRVGNVLTTANENLRSEKATNFETGIRLAGENYGIRATAFVTEIDRAIANVTLSSTPSLITRQRQNAGKTRTSGFEIDSEMRIEKLQVNAGYLFADSRVIAFDSNPALIDKFIPQVPRHQLTFQAKYPVSKFILAFQGRASSKQYDDDLNVFRLEPYFQMDAFVSRRLKEKISVFASLENLFDSRYSVGKTPVRTLSSPKNLRIGVRWN